MGKRDYWPYDKQDWKRWADRNKNFWHSPEGHRYGRYMGRGRMLGRIIFFALGFWAGSWANHRYRLPSANPREAWEDMKTATENIRQQHPDVGDSPELSEILQKVKQLEKRYRRPRDTDDHEPGTSGEGRPPASKDPEAPGTKSSE